MGEGILITYLKLQENSEFLNHLLLGKEPPIPREKYLGQEMFDQCCITRYQKNSTLATSVNQIRTFLIFFFLVSKFLKNEFQIPATKFFLEVSSELKKVKICNRNQL